MEINETVIIDVDIQQAPPHPLDQWIGWEEDDFSPKVTPQTVVHEVKEILWAAGYPHASFDLVGVSVGTLGDPVAVWQGDLLVFEHRERMVAWQVWESLLDIIQFPRECSYAYIDLRKQEISMICGAQGVTTWPIPPQD